MKTLLLSLLLSPGLLGAETKAQMDAAKAAHKPVLDAEQDAYKATHARYEERAAKKATPNGKLTYSTIPFTHGRQGEGYAIDWFYDDGTNVWTEREVRGPAGSEHLNHGWTVVRPVVLAPDQPKGKTP